MGNSGGFGSLFQKFPMTFVRVRYDQPNHCCNTLRTNDQPGGGQLGCRRHPHGQSRHCVHFEHIVWRLTPAGEVEARNLPGVPAKLPKDRLKLCYVVLCCVALRCRVLRSVVCVVVFILCRAVPYRVVLRWVVLRLFR